MVDRIRRDVVDAGRSRPGHSVYPGPLYQAAEPGIGLGAALVPQYTQFHIGSFGWRFAYLGLGLLTLIVAFPAVFLFIREPAKAKAAAGGVRAQSPASLDRLPDLEVREALGGRRFWLIACALLLVSTVTQGLV